MVLPFWVTPPPLPCFLVRLVFQSTFGHPQLLLIFNGGLKKISGLEPAPPPNLDAGATPLLEGSVVGGEVGPEYSFQYFKIFGNIWEY